MKRSIRLNKLLINMGGLILTLVFSIGLITIVSISKIQKSQLQSSTDTSIEIKSLKSKYHVVQIQQYLTDAALTGESDSIKEAKDNLAELEKNLDELNVLEPQWQGRTEEIRTSSRKLMDIGIEMMDAYQKNGKSAGDLIMKRPETGLDAMSELLGKSLETLANDAVNRQIESQKNVENSNENLKINTIILSFFEIVLMSGLFVVVFRRIQPLIQIHQGLKISADKISDSSMAMAYSADEISKANNNQAAATQQTAASLEEIHAMVGKTSDNSVRLKSGAGTSNQLVLTGKETLDNLLDGLNEIDKGNQNLVTDVDHGNQEVRGILKIITEISNKTNVINDIVFQTKLLSFNASIEAARAGDYGKGFAVVAQEIGKLASMSGETAKSINVMLASGKKNVEDIINDNKNRLEKSTRSTQSKIKEGVKTATVCKETFDQIIIQVGEVNVISDEITTAIDEQRKGLHEIGKAISELEKATNSNVSTSEIALENSELLKESVNFLRNSVFEVSQIIGGESSIQTNNASDNQDKEDASFSSDGRSRDNSGKNITKKVA